VQVIGHAPSVHEVLGGPNALGGFSLRLSIASSRRKSSLVTSRSVPEGFRHSATEVVG